MIKAKSVIAVALGVAAAGVVAPLSSLAGSDDVATQIVDALNKRYGVHPGYRANHAKGIVVEGRFKASPEAGALTKSPIFAGAVLPVTVRFSDAGGQPQLHDGSPAANPHGIAIKFQLPNGAESDIVTNSFKFFPVATPEDFRDLQFAAAASPPGTPKPTQLEQFILSHPGVPKASATLGNPASFADEQYYGIDAFVFTDQAGHMQAFRYIIAPQHMVHLSDAQAAAKTPGYLMEDLPARLKKGPVTFHIKAQLAEAGDSTKDPTKAWPDDRKVVDLGVLTIDKAIADSAAAEKKLLFLPGNLTDGIEPSDDPLIPARDNSYAVSFGRRSESQ
jgi:catalase